MRSCGERSRGFADVIFASSRAQREFWLGERDLNPLEIRARYGGLKPCPHGSDAHKLEDVATSFGDRYSWIKGGSDFDSLRQALRASVKRRRFPRFRNGSELVSADRETQRRYSALSSRIATETATLQTLAAKLQDCEDAGERARGLQSEREQAYGRAFDALVAEQAVLEQLYEPLMTRLVQASGTLKKLSFSVARVADVEAWANQAEEGLIDLRKVGAFKGKGALLRKANDVLRSAWEKGTSVEVVAAMRKFRQKYQKDLLAHSPTLLSHRSSN